MFPGLAHACFPKCMVSACACACMACLFVRACVSAFSPSLFRSSQPNRCQALTLLKGLDLPIIATTCAHPRPCAAHILPSQSCVCRLSQATLHPVYVPVGYRSSASAPSLAHARACTCCPLGPHSLLLCPPACFFSWLAHACLPKCMVSVCACACMLG